MVDTKIEFNNMHVREIYRNIRDLLSAGNKASKQMRELQEETRESALLLPGSVNFLEPSEKKEIDTKILEAFKKMNS